MFGVDFLLVKLGTVDQPAYELTEGFCHSPRDPVFVDIRNGRLANGATLRVVKHHGVMTP